MALLKTMAAVKVKVKLDKKLVQKAVEKGPGG